MERPVGFVGRLGLTASYDGLAAAVGGAPRFRRMLKAMTVTARLSAYQRSKRQGGRPKIVRGFRLGTVDGVQCVTMSPDAGRRLLKHGVLSRIEYGAASNAPLVGRRLDAPAGGLLTQPLYPYQAAAAQFLCAAAGPLGYDSQVRHKGVRAYLQMDAGLGKSRVGCALIAVFRVWTLIVVPTEAIRQHWLDECAEVLPDVPCGAYRNTENVRHPISVGIINTVRAKPPAWFDGYGLVIFDEAHEYHTTENINALWHAQTGIVLGLSATPHEREDLLDRSVAFFLGRPIWAAKDIPAFDAGGVAFRGRVLEVAYRGAPEYCAPVLTPAGTTCVVSTIGRIVGDPARLRMVAAEVEWLYRLDETLPPAEAAAHGLGPRPAEAADAGHPAGGVRRHGVLVFAELRDYLPALRDAIARRVGMDAVVAPELDAGTGVEVLRGGASRENLGRAHRARIVLTTFGYSRRGISLERMTSCVLATPRRHGYTQILGRIFRRGSDESIERLIVDVVDMRSGLRTQNADRRVVYKKKRFPVCRVSVDHTAYADDRAPAPDHFASALRVVWAPGDTGVGAVEGGARGDDGDTARAIAASLAILDRL